MSRRALPTEVKFFYSILFNELRFSEEQVDLLVLQKFKANQKFFPEFNPLITYYAHEMDKPLKRILYFGEEKRSRDLLVTRKAMAMELEQEHSLDNRRFINIDVGFVAPEQVVLATGKPYSHRLYLRDGVYGELVYFFQNKSYQKLPWTYPDYQHQEKIEFFNSIR